MNAPPIERASSPSRTRIRVLILEDNPSDADLMVDALVQAGLDPSWERVDDPADFADRLTPELDLILSDYALPQFTGLQALQLVRSRGLDVPFILVSGSIGEEIAVEAMRSGADDYLLKDRMARLGPAVVQALERHRLRAETERAESARRESEERFRQIAENIREVFWLTDPSKNEMLYVSPAYEKIWGRSCESLRKSPHAWLDAIHPDDRSRVLQAAQTKQASGDYAEDYRISRPDGSVRWIRDRAFPVLDQSGRVFRVAGVAEDITERKLQEQKIEKLSRIRAVSSEINAAIVRSRSRQELFNEACRIAVDYGNFGIAWVGLYDPGARTVTPAAWGGQDDPEHIKTFVANVRDERSLGSGELIRAIREKAPIFSNDISADPDAGGMRRLEAVKRGYRSHIVLPLMIEGQVAATLALFTKDTDYFTDDEVKLLTELAGNLSFALEHIARQQKVEKLSRIRAFSSEINAAIVRIRDRKALLEETCHIASSQGKFETVWIGTVNEEKQEIRAAVWSGFSPEIANRVSWNSASAAQGTLNEAIRTRKPSVRNDIENELPVGGMRAEALRRGCGSTVCLPLVVDDHVVALVALFAAGTGFFDEDELALLAEVAADVSFALQSIAQQEKVEYLSYYDALTGLPNRTLFIDRLGQQFHGRSGAPSMVALILLNVERFRNINETFGRHGGDALLKLVARRLEGVFHGKDYLARIAADGFGVVVRGIQDAAGVAHAIENQAAECFREPFLLNGAELRVAAKAGIALFPADGGDADTLFKNAEAALKKARESGERYLFYASEMNARAAQALSLETRLRKAVEAQQFVLHYQPKIRLSTGAICGLEALIRWQEPGAGLIPPGYFIPILEETGLILEVGKWALARALADHGAWTVRGCPVPRIAVNVSAIQLQRHDFAAMVIDVVQQEGGNPDDLELEITESLLMKDVQESIRKLSILRDLGIQIAMDDFGTGYSSLSYIARLPINSVKIDRSFISGMAGSTQDLAIVTTIIALAHSLNLKVIAEGVETEEQANMIKLLKCDEAQGYLYSRPVPAAEIELLLRAPTAAIGSGAKARSAVSRKVSRTARTRSKRQRRQTSD